MSELKRHKKSDAIKWTATSVAFLFVALILVGVCLQVFGKGKVKPSEWFKKDDETEQTTPEPDTDSGLVVTSGENKNGIALNITKGRANAANDAAAQSEATYTITATVLPTAAQYGAVEWSIAWANANSTWVVNGTLRANVSDYLTLTPSGLSATVECLQAFGEQAVITFRIVDDEDAVAQCTVDYKQRYLGTSTSLSYNFVGGADTWRISNYCTNMGEDYDTRQNHNDVLAAAGKASPVFDSAAFVPQLSNTYTIPLTSSATFRYSIGASPALQYAIQSYTQNITGCTLNYMYLTIPKLFTEATVENVSEDSRVPMPCRSGYDKLYISSYFSTLCPAVESSNGIFSNDQYPFFMQACDSAANNPSYTGNDRFTFNIKVEAIIDGVSYTDVERIYLTNWQIKVSGVSLDTEALCF